MTWTYRVTRDEHGGHRIAEVYTTLDAPMWTTDPIAPWGESVDEVRNVMARMMLALEKPVLDEAQLLAAATAHVTTQG